MSLYFWPSTQPHDCTATEVSFCHSIGRMAAFWPRSTSYTAAPGWEGVELVVDRHRTVAGDAPVVVPGRELGQPGLEHVLLDPPVEPDQLRVIVLDELDGPGEPVLEERLRRSDLLALRGAVEVGELGITDIGVELHAAVEEPPVLGAMARRAGDH